MVGYGRATKTQMQEMVTRLLNLSGQPADAADALGMAICHAHGGDTLSTLGGLAPALAKKGCACGAGGWSADGGAHRGPARRLDCVGHLGCADHLDRFTRARRARAMHRPRLMADSVGIAPHVRYTRAFFLASSHP